MCLKGVICTSFKHLNIAERESIFLWLNQGVSNREIAKRLLRDHRSIDNEIENNTKYGKKYSPHLAQKRAVREGTRQRYKAPLKGPEVFLYVREHLRSPYFWTPEMISGRIGLDIKGVSISIEAIYQHIYARKNRRYELWAHLPLGRKKRCKKFGRKVHSNSKIPNAVSIDLRPKYINNRKKIGHWETDNVEGPRKSKPALSVSTERVVRYVRIIKVGSHSATEKVRSLRRTFDKYPKALRLSITQDNGMENTNHEVVTQFLGVQMFFCHAYHSWEKGTVENRNKVIRRFFPKGTDFSDVSVGQIQFVEDVINNMPLRCLRFRTPNEKISQLMYKLKST